MLLLMGKNIVFWCFFPAHVIQHCYGFCLSDILPGLPTAVQLRHPGADGALALPPGVDRHLLHPEPGLGENSGGDAPKACPSPTNR